LKLTRYMFVILVAAMMLLPQTTAADERPPIVFVDTVEIDFEVDPQIIDGTTLVQFRPLFEAMGMEISWDGSQRLVTGTKEGLEIKLRIGEEEASVNGKTIELSQSARIIEGNTMVPLRFVAESTGALVYWDGLNREISVVSVEGLAFLGMTKEELKQKLDELIEEQEKQAAENDPPESPPEKKPAPPKVALAPVNVESLDGMYYGLRDDFGGYECGGMCWDLYTFFPNNQVFIGVPPLGGPETIDCARDGCDTFTISEGMMELANGESYSIGMEESGQLVINDVDMISVKTAPKDTKLNDTYKHIQYTGFVGINPFSSSSTQYMTFRSDGTFEGSKIDLASLDVGSSATNSSSSSENTGTYTISGNTITFTFDDGTVAKTLFFIHEDNDGAASDGEIQIGSKYFYVDSED
jgi:hypothetical protein